MGSIRKLFEAAISPEDKETLKKRETLASKTKNPGFSDAKGSDMSKSFKKGDDEHHSAKDNKEGQKAIAKNTSSGEASDKIVKNIVSGLAPELKGKDGWKIGSQIDDFGLSLKYKSIFSDHDKEEFKQLFPGADQSNIQWLAGLYKSVSNAIRKGNNEMKESYTLGDRFTQLFESYRDVDHEEAREDKEYEGTESEEFEAGEEEETIEEGYKEDKADEEEFFEFCADTYPDIKIMGRTFEQARALKELDEVAFREALAEWVDTRDAAFAEEAASDEDEDE